MQKSHRGGLKTSVLNGGVLLKSLVLGEKKKRQQTTQMSYRSANVKLAYDSLANVAIFHTDVLFFEKKSFYKPEKHEKKKKNKQSMLDDWYHNW